MSKIFRIEKLKKEIYLKTSILQFFNSSILLYYLIAELLTEVEAHFLEFELLDLTRAGEGELVDEEDIFGDFVAGNLATTELLYILGLHLHTLLEDNEGTHSLTVFLGRHSRHLHIANARHVIEELLDLTGIDILTTTDDHILDTTCDLIEALFVFHTQVA